MVKPWRLRRCSVSATMVPRQEIGAASGRGAGAVRSVPSPLLVIDRTSIGLIAGSEKEEKESRGRRRKTSFPLPGQSRVEQPAYIGDSSRVKSSRVEVESSRGWPRYRMGAIEFEAKTMMVENDCLEPRLGRRRQMERPRL